MDFLNQGSALIEMIANHPVLATLLGLGLVDALLRRKETEKAVSLILGFQMLLQGGIKLAQALDKLISKIIPHKIAAPVLPEAQPQQDSEKK